MAAPSICQCNEPLSNLRAKESHVFSLGLYFG